MEQTIVALAIVFVAIIILIKTAIVVPQQNAYVVERLGKYSKTLSAGFHILQISQNKFVLPRTTCR